MKKLQMYFFLITPIIAILGGYGLYKYGQIEHDNFCKTTQNLDAINSCIYNNHLSYQDRYDIFLNYSTKTDNPIFVDNFNAAYNDCLVHSNECLLRDKNALINVQTKCAMSGYPACVEHFLQNNSIINKTNITIFNNAVTSNINNKYTGSCMLYYSFFKQLNSQQQQQLSPDVIDSCTQDGHYLELHPDLK
jgi:hypothetical protein